MSRSGAPRADRLPDGSHVYTAGSPTGARRRRRLLRLALVATAMVLLLLGVWTLLPHGGGRDDQVASTTCPAPPAGITVDVLNATSRAGLAGVTADALRAQRFTVGQAINAPEGTTLDVPAEIRYSPDAATGAKVLAHYVPGAVLVEDRRRSGTKVDLVVGPDLSAVTTPQSAPTC